MKKLNTFLFQNRQFLFAHKFELKTTKRVVILSSNTPVDSQIDTSAAKLLTKNRNIKDRLNLLPNIHHPVKMHHKYV